MLNFDLCISVEQNVVVPRSVIMPQIEVVIQPASSGDPSYHPSSQKGSDKGSSVDVIPNVEEQRENSPSKTKTQQSHTSHTDEGMEAEKEKTTDDAGTPVPMDGVEVQEHITEEELPLTEKVVENSSGDGSPDLNNPRGNEQGYGDDEEDTMLENEGHDGGDANEEDPKTDSRGKNEGDPNITKPSETQGIASTGTPTNPSREALEALKCTNPLEYLRLMVSTKGSSSDQSGSTSSTTDNVNQTNNEVLSKIKARIFKRDLFASLQGDPSAAYAFKELLKQVNVASVSNEVASIIVELGLIVEQAAGDFRRLKTTMSAIEGKAGSAAAAWHLAHESIDKVAGLEKTLEANKKEAEACDHNIAAWESEIQELQDKISKARERKAAIQNFDQSELQTEIEEGVEHVEKAQKLELELVDLRSQQSTCETRLEILKSKYLSMKTFLPF